MAISVKDYGAFGDGVHDDYVAFQAALDLHAGTVTVPPGIYLISKTLKIHSNTCIVADQHPAAIPRRIIRKSPDNYEKVLQYKQICATM